MSVTISSKSKRRSAGVSKDEKLITESLKRFKITAEAESESRRQGLEDLRFSIGTGQWDEAVKANREIEGKPCLTINRAPAFLRQYTGEERQHRPAMLVSPVGSGADVDTAKIHQGVLRHIEVASVADVTYDNSYDMMMRTGWCPWRVKEDYVHETSFDREPRIDSIENPFAAYLSPVRNSLGQDPLWAHIVTDYSKEEYIAEFGKTDLAQLRFPTSLGNAEPGWVTKDGARVAEYWCIELQPKTLVLFDDGTSKLKDEVTREDRIHGGIADQRDTIIRKVHCVKHDALRVLKRYDYLGKYIPFPEVNGVRLNVNGKIYRAGMVRDYRDAQRIYDFMVTRAVEQVDMVSKDPLWVPDDNAQYGEDYRQMNRKNFSHLFYKAYDNNGKQLPPPQRAGREAPIEAMSKIIQQADYDMKAVIGIYGPSLGEESGNAQESGFAIMTRQQQSDTAAISWHDNLNRAIMWQGKILLDLWPKLIPAARVQRIINPDDSVKHAVVFNGQNSDPEEAMNMLNAQLGLKKAYDVGAGVYDLTLSTGPMYKDARQEAFRAMTALIAEEPQMITMIGDVWAKNADFPDADVLAQRFKKMLPPNLQDESADDAQSRLVQAQAQIAQLGEQYNTLLQEMNRAADTIRTKRLDLESRERVALSNNQTQLILQAMKEHSAGAQAQLEAELGAITMRLQKLHDMVGIEDDAGAAPDTPELPGQVEPKVQPITPAAPTPRPQPVMQ
jgi:Phage P22-like portal protein